MGETRDEEGERGERKHILASKTRGAKEGKRRCDVFFTVSRVESGRYPVSRDPETRKDSAKPKKLEQNPTHFLTRGSISGESSESIKVVASFPS